MSRESVFRPDYGRVEYGLIGAGAVNTSLVGRIPGKAQALGPVAGTSYRVASRIANTLRAGQAVRSADELDSVRVILFHAPPDQMAALADLLETANIRWPGKSLIYCDCEDSRLSGNRLRARGASVALLREFGIAGRVLVEGTTPAITFASQFARRLQMKAVEIGTGCGDTFDAAVMLGRGALTPLIDQAAALFRRCGLRDSEAVQMASGIFEQTAREYAHSGKQSWAWHKREPDPERLTEQIAAAGPRLAALLAELVLLGFDSLERHPEASRAVRDWLARRDAAEPRS
jgi:hypothetical protein